MIHVLTVLAFSMVSAVVKVLEAFFAWVVSCVMVCGLLVFWGVVGSIADQFRIHNMANGEPRGRVDIGT